jgi:hypothetical protein
MQPEQSVKSDVFVMAYVFCRERMAARVAYKSLITLAVEDDDHLKDFDILSQLIEPVGQMLPVDFAQKAGRLPCQLAAEAPRRPCGQHCDQPNAARGPDPYYA